MDFKLLALKAVKENNEELLNRILHFLIRCNKESKDEVRNSIYVTFFENMPKEGLEYFLPRLPKEFAEEVKTFLKGFDTFTTQTEIK